MQDLPPGVTAKLLPSHSLVAVKKHVQHSEHSWWGGGNTKTRHLEKCKETAKPVMMPWTLNQHPGICSQGPFPARGVSQAGDKGEGTSAGHRLEELAPVHSLEGSLASCFVWLAPISFNLHGDFYFHSNLFPSLFEQSNLMRQLLI